MILIILKIVKHTTLLFITLCGAAVLWGYTPFDESISYSKNQIVVSDGVSYISLQSVPAGTSITSTAYWIPLLDTVPSAPSTTAPDDEPNESGLPNDPPDDNDSDLDGIPNSVEVEIGSDPNISDSIIFNYAMQLGVTKGVDLVSNNPESYGLITVSAHELALSDANSSANQAIADAMDMGVEVGKDLVLGDPVAFSLITLSEHLSNISQATGQGIQQVLNDPNSYNLISKGDHEDLVQSFQVSGDISNNPYTEGWFFVPNRGWLWTQASVHPWIYDQGSSNWLYFKQGHSLPLFFDNESKRWIDWNDFIHAP